MAWTRDDQLTAKQKILLRYAPFRVDTVSSMLYRDPHQATREHHLTVDPRGVLPRRLDHAVWLDSFDPQNRPLLRRPRLAVRAVDPDEVDPPHGQPVSAPSEGSFNRPVEREPIFDPMHNLRAIGKELTLLEDHLGQPSRHCNDCIRKHLVRAEAFGEEGISLDKTGEYVSVFGGLLQEIRGLQGPALHPEVNRHALGQHVRKIRKRVLQQAYPVQASANVQPSADPVDALGAAVAREVSDLRLLGVRVRPVKARRLSDGSAVAGWCCVGRSEEDAVACRRAAKRAARTVGGRVVAGRDGDGRPVYGVQVRGKGAPLPAQDAVSALVGAAEGVASSKLKPGVKVIGALEDQGKRVWVRGEVLPIGSQAGGYPVKAIPEDGWVAIGLPDGTGGWVRENDLVVQPDAPLSVELARAGGVRKYGRGGFGTSPMTDAKLLMVDVIQAVLRDRLNLPQPVLDDVARAAAINALYESNLDPLASGDSGKSIGLFQLHSSGGGAGMSVEERQSPILNTERIAREFDAAVKANAPLPDSEFLAKLRAPKGIPSPEAARQQLGVPTLGQLVAAALDGQRPSVGTWAAAWSLQVERPLDTIGEAAARKRAADDIWSPTQPGVSSAVSAPPTPDALVPSADKAPRAVPIAMVPEKSSMAPGPVPISRLRRPEPAPAPAPAPKPEPESGTETWLLAGAAAVAALAAGLAWSQARRGA